MRGVHNHSGKTVLLTTHNMEEADALCQRLAIVDHGVIIALGTPTELKASVPGGYLLRLRFGHHAPDLLERLQSLAGVREVRATENNGADLYADRGGSLVSEVANLALALRISSCATCTSPNRASRISFCTTLAGACANEL